jgi:ribosomal protein S18 acetylase RimI-like enzyme
MLFQSLIQLTFTLISVPISPGPTRAATLQQRSATRMMARVDVRVASEAEVRPSGRDSVFKPVAELCAEGLFQTPKSGRDSAVLAGALFNDLVEHFSRRNREKNALLLAEDVPAAQVVGSVGIEVVFLSASGHSIRRQRLEDQATMAARPLLSNLVVDRGYRRQGIANRLCKGAEEAAKGWGYDEIYLKVDKTNTKALNLYRKHGYRPVPDGEDTEAEKPVVQGGRLRYEPTTTLALRKDLRKPPPDVVVRNGAMAAAALAAVVNAQALEQGALGLVSKLLGADAAAAAEQAVGAILRLPA